WLRGGGAAGEVCEASVCMLLCGGCCGAADTVFLLAPQLTRLRACALSPPQRPAVGGARQFLQLGAQRPDFGEQHHVQHLAQIADAAGA
ncbi:hypothetical protein OH413_25645, partial [Salmonella enterica]|nr:hypothetical protein [Salmonella enterica]